MDGISVAASIIAVATAGIQISIKVVTLADQVSTAADRVSSIGNDVSLTSGILHQLGELMSQSPDEGLPTFSKAGLETTKTSTETCRKIFEEIERETAKASKSIGGRKRPIGEKVKLSVVEKAKWPFLQPSLEFLRIDLREAKQTLMLMLQLASLALSRRVADLNTSTSSTMTEQRDISRSILLLQQEQQKSKPWRKEKGQSQEAQNISKAATVHDTSEDLDTNSIAVSSPSSSRTAPRIKIKEDTRITKLRLSYIYPILHPYFDRITISWGWCDGRFSEDELRKQMNKNQADSLTSVLTMWDDLHFSERAIISYFLDVVDNAYEEFDVILRFFKRFEQNLQHGMMTFQALPSFQVIFELEGLPKSQPQAARHYDGVDPRIQPLTPPMHHSHYDPTNPILDSVSGIAESDSGDSSRHAVRYIEIKPGTKPPKEYSHQGSKSQGREKLKHVTRGPVSASTNFEESDDASVAGFGAGWQDRAPDSPRRHRRHSRHRREPHRSPSPVLDLEYERRMRRLAELERKEELDEDPALDPEPVTLADGSVPNLPEEETTEVAEDEADEIAAVTELLREYTTLFEQAL